MIREPSTRSSLRLVIHSALFLPTQGGAELYVHNISKNLASSIEVTILTRPSRAPWRVDGSERIVRLPSWAIPFYFVWMTMRRRPDVLHVGLIGFESIVLFAIAKVARIPCILTYHGTYSLGNFDPLRRVRLPVLLLENLTLRIPWDALACVDYHSENFLQARFGISRQRLHVIPSGVDVGQFHPGLDRDSAKASGAYTILCPRRVDPKNGIEYIIRAVTICKPKIPALSLVIAGRTNDGMEGYEKFLRDIVRTSNSGSYVTFLGDIEHGKMSRLYNSADIVVIPSLAEARSLSALEAMACERPVIATKVGGLPEIVRDGFSGVLVNPADANDLANAIYRLFSRPDLGDVLGRNGRKMALENQWKARADEYELLYAHAVSGKLHS